MNTKYNILIVDDNAGNRLLLQYNLTGYFEIDFACNGLAAIEKYRKNHYDMILMDINMPELNGIETTKKIREIENGKSHMPIFAITSNIFLGQKEECLQNGFDDYIIKPIHASALVERISHYFNTSASLGNITKKDR